MKTKKTSEEAFSKKGSPKKIFIVSIIAFIILMPIGVSFSDTFGERITMWLIHNYYSEECYNHKKELANVTETVCNGYVTCMVNYTTSSSSDCSCSTGWEEENVTKLVYTDECLKYHLVRLVE